MAFELNYSCELEKPLWLFVCTKSKFSFAVFFRMSRSGTVLDVRFVWFLYCTLLTILPQKINFIQRLECGLRPFCGSSFFKVFLIFKPDTVRFAWFFFIFRLISIFAWIFRLDTLLHYVPCSCFFTAHFGCSWLPWYKSKSYTTFRMYVRTFLSFQDNICFVDDLENKTF